MQNVFQFGNYSIAKDLIFGWHFQYGESGWVSVRDVGTEILEAASRQSYPEYVPASFKEAVMSELESRKAAVEAPDVKTVPSISRANDTIALLTQLLESTPVGTVFELPYLRLEVTHDVWVLAATSGNCKAETISKECCSFEDVIGRIMARWW